MHEAPHPCWTPTPCRLDWLPIWQMRHWSQKGQVSWAGFQLCPLTAFAD